ncbi:MAG: Oxidoreductase, GMC family, partial [uncultured Rubrobacteraceae bacterium]
GGAGALRSPQLLMVSGIGPAGHLREMGIGVAHDLPGVGQNLHDHPMVTPVWPVTEGSTMLAAGEPEPVREYALLRRGPLASANFQAAAMLRTGEEDRKSTR